MIMNDTFLKACRGEKTDYTPIWMMRQAGRYLPEYQKVRGNVTFLELCKSPELCVEVTLQPIDILNMDAAILFSDILILMEAMGAPLEFHEGRGPIFPKTFRDGKSIERLIIPDADETMPFVMETIRLLRKELTVPLIGFAGAPFTCATYLIEGGSSKVFWETKKMMFTAPELFHQLMDKITESTILYLQAQARAGARHYRSLTAGLEFSLLLILLSLLFHMCRKSSAASNNLIFPLSTLPITEPPSLISRSAPGLM